MSKRLNIMVCVTAQQSCERLLKRGIERRAEGADLHVVHCVSTGHYFMNTPYEADAIEYLFTAAQLAGGELNMIRKDDVDDALVEFANEHGIGLIVMGASRQQDQSETIITRLQQRLPGVEFDVMA